MLPSRTAVVALWLCGTCAAAPQLIAQEASPLADALSVSELPGEPQPVLLDDLLAGRYVDSEVRGPARDELFISDELRESDRRRAIPESSRRERLIDRLTDPTEWLMSFRLRQSWNQPLNANAGETQETEFRPTIPFIAWDCENILRVTLPYDVQSPSGAGLSDVTIFDLIVTQASWGRWGVGPVVRLVPESSDGSNEFQIGPAAGAVMKNSHWTVGVLSQNYFSDDVGQSRLQPILAFKPSERWAIGVGEFEFRYDWEDGRWTQLPLGLQVERIADLFGQKVDLFANPQYNFASGSSNSGWTFYLGLSLLVPEA
jgi:hypothetical protein